MRAPAAGLRRTTAAVCCLALFGASAATALTANQAPPNPPRAGYSRETPASLNCIYQVLTPVANCDPNNTTLPSNTTLGAGVIVVVSRYHYATLAADLQAYAAQFGLPAPNLTVVPNSSTPTCNDAPQDSDVFGRFTAFTCYEYGTNVLEMAHAMAPAASLVYVEAPGTTPAQNQAAITTAVTQARNFGGGEVVLSAFFLEDSSAQTLDAGLAPSSANANVLFFAPAGYASTLTYPGSSPNVVSVSSSEISRDMENPSNIGGYLGERAGQSGVGGLSALFAAPAFQNRIAARVGNANKRAVPDITATGNGNNNVWVYNKGGWYGASGPLMPVGIAAGIANAAGASTYFQNSTSLLTSLYAKIGTSSFFDVGIGICGAYDGAFTTVSDRNSRLNQWDFCSGVGAPRGLTGFRP